jgi:hypothetical protein
MEDEFNIPFKFKRSNLSRHPHDILLRHMQQNEDIYGSLFDSPEALKHYLSENIRIMDTGFTRETVTNKGEIVSVVVTDPEGQAKRISTAFDCLNKQRELLSGESKQMNVTISFTEIDTIEDDE